MFSVSETWKSAYAGAYVGVLAMRNVANPAQHAGLERQKEALEAQLRSRFDGQTRSALEALPTLQAYKVYYKPFKKTYHVQFQVESIAYKGKSIPSVAALVEAMFMAEVKNMLLTAGHDLDVLDLPVTLDVAKGDETYTSLQGQPQTLKAGDMMMHDGQGIISSIIYGPDQRTRIQASTRNAMFCVYAPCGISNETITAHLQDIEQYVRLVSPTAQVDMLQVVGSA